MCDNCRKAETFKILWIDPQPDWLNYMIDYFTPAFEVIPRTTMPIAKSDFHGVSLVIVEPGPFSVASVVKHLRARTVAPILVTTARKEKILSACKLPGVSVITKPFEDREIGQMVLCLAGIEEFNGAVDPEC